MNTIVLDEPLGLPKGSVRAVLAVVLLGSIAVFMYMGIEIPEWYSTLATAYAMFYIGTRVPNNA